MAPHVILTDADFLDCVLFDLTVNFERMLGRRIPPADLCRWLDCVALDGGLRPGDNEIEAVFIHDKATLQLKNARPAVFADEFNDKAFKDNLGEFTLRSFPVEPLVSKDDFVVQSFEALLAEKSVSSIMVVANMDTPVSDRLRRACVSADTDKNITLFAMQPLPGRGFSQEILGYSLMAALGISGDELV